MENELKIENNSFNYINSELNKGNEQIKDNNNNNEYRGIGNNIIHPNIPGVDGYKVFIRQDGYPDFGNFISFDNTVEFDPNKYKRPEIYFGYVHDQYLIPQILGTKNMKKKEKEEEKKENEEKYNKEKEEYERQRKDNENKIKMMDELIKVEDDKNKKEKLGQEDLIKKF